MVGDNAAVKIQVNSGNRRQKCLLLSELQQESVCTCCSTYYT